jgi:hypothetical protein
MGNARNTRKSNARIVFYGVRAMHIVMQRVAKLIYAEVNAWNNRDILLGNEAVNKLCQ